MDGKDKAKESKDTTISLGGGIDTTTSFVDPAETDNAKESNNTWCSPSCRKYARGVYVLFLIAAIVLVGAFGLPNNE